MKNDRENRMEQLPDAILKQLKYPPRLEVPAFDPAWLEQEPSAVYREKGQGGKILSFPGSRAFLSAAAAILLAAGLYFAYPYLSVQGSTPIELYGAATGTGVSVESSKEVAQHWNLGVLNSGQIIRTGNESLDLMASNGVIIRIYPESVIEIKESMGQLKLRQEKGTVLAEVRKKDDSSSENATLEIQTPHTNVLVTGTVFHLTVDEQKSELYLEQGTLKMAETAIPAQNMARKGLDSPLEIEPQAAPANTESEAESLRNSTDLLARKWIPEMKRLDKVREEKQISEMYGQSLEKIILKDGRILQGVVAAQQGDRLMLHTTSGVVVVRRDNVQEIVYEN